MRTAAWPLVRRAGVFAIAWWLMTGGELNSWWIGLPAIAAATSWRGAHRQQARRIRWSALPRFLTFLATRSAISSVDVARRSLSPQVEVDPVMFEYSTTLSAGRVALAALVTLLPGTLVMRLDGDRLLVHALASSSASHGEIRQLEAHLARLLGVDRVEGARVG
ncbi:MAG: Na+/H+ antiporter subunit E [Vicinamibacterales bacterium]